MYLISYIHLNSQTFGNSVLLELNVKVHQKFQIYHRCISHETA